MLFRSRVEDQRLKAARCQHEYDLRLLAEEAAVRYFRLACKQRVLQMRLKEMYLNDTLWPLPARKQQLLSSLWQNYTP